MSKLSVNINKLATLRNARGNNVPDLLQAAKDIERFGAQGITVHPRPDERHITYVDKERFRKTYYLTDELVGYNAEIAKRLKYTKEILHQLLTGVKN